ncbi:hypothetical protein I503_02766 [Candida albicans SC5314]|nr:hypothetical protein I503_02766 [Candida albicans SC5314]
MTKEPYFISNLTSIKPSNNRNYSIVSPDLPSLTNTQLKYAPPLTTNINNSTNIDVGNKARKRSIEPYYSKPVKIGVLPPAILNQFAYHFHDECAIIDDDDENNEELINYSGSVIAPGNMLGTVFDNYDQHESETYTEEYSNIDCFRKLMAKVKVPLVNDGVGSNINTFRLEHYFKHNGESLKEKLLDKSNNPNVLINERSRKLSDSLSAPDLQQVGFASDHYDYSEDSYSTVIRGNARDDYGDNNEPYSFLI